MPSARGQAWSLRSHAPVISTSAHPTLTAIGGGGEGGALAAGPCNGGPVFSAPVGAAECRSQGAVRD